MPVRRKPVYSLHKSSGQARVRIDGREVYLRVYGSPESLARYDELILKWLACDPEAARGAGRRFVAIPPPTPFIGGEALRREDPQPSAAESSGPSARDPR